MSQSQHGVGQLTDIAMFHQQTGLLGDADFRCSIDVETDDRFSGQQSLRDDSGQAFPVACVNDDVHRMQIIGHNVRRDEPCEAKVIGQSQSGDASFVFGSQNSITDEQKPDIGHLCSHRGGGFDQVVVPFQMKQASYFANDNI